MRGYGNFIANTNGKNFEPCPFCGSGSQTIHEIGCGASTEEFYYKYGVFCECGATLEGKAVVRTGATVDRESWIADSAMRKWNGRKEQ